ncbi:MAG: isochorismate synthase [Chlorobiaceae bacterium]|nr:isochorismate synthase [Chlorobiaceae bacterium]
MSDKRHTIIPDNNQLPLQKAIESLLHEIERFKETAASQFEGSRSGSLLTFSQPLLALDTLDWLNRQDLFPRLYWMNREKNYSVAGLGTADCIEQNSQATNASGFTELTRSIATKDPDARYFGAFRFNNMEEQSEPWQSFSSYTFILPLILITFEQDLYTLSCNLWLEAGELPELKIRGICDALERISIKQKHSANGRKMPDLQRISCNPDEQNWTMHCKRALQTFESGEMDKIMLARQTILEFSGSFSPLLFLINYPYPQNSTYRFYFEPIKNHAFFSFTPERLYRREGSTLHTEALAGTSLKENINGDDNLASEILLNSEKDIREHKFVKDSIYRELFPVCSEIQMEEQVHVLQLNRLAHLYTRCSATLKPEFSNDSTVLTRLHPTPAVGGVPKDEALRHILEIEPFSRGWYAGPSGWISSNAAEFCVGIRSGVVAEAMTFLYSGAGLVKGSDPGSEWAEIEQKIGDLMTIANGDT